MKHFFSGAVFLFIALQNGFCQTDTLSSLPGSINEYFYKIMQENVLYPKLAKDEVKSGTCFLTLEVHDSELLSATISNSLGTKYDASVFSGLEKFKAVMKSAGHAGSFVAIVPITFGLDGANFVRTIAPPILCDEIKVISRNYSKGISQDFLLKEFQKEFKNGNYAKSLKYLDNLILLDPYKPIYRRERIKILVLSGENKLACDDYHFLKYVINYASSPASPCGK